MEGRHEADGFVPAKVSRKQAKQDWKRAKAEAKELGPKFWRRSS